MILVSGISFVLNEFLFIFSIVQISFYQDRYSNSVPALDFAQLSPVFAEPEKLLLQTFLFQSPSWLKIVKII